MGSARRPGLRPRGRRHRDAGLRPVARSRSGPRSCRTGCPGSRRCCRSARPRSATDLIALAETFDAAAARRARRRPRGRHRPHLHRRHDRQAQGRHADLPQRRDADPDPARRVGVAGGHALPDRDAAVARRRGVLHPDAAARRLHRRTSAASTRPRCSRRSRSTRSPRRCSCRRCSTSSWTTRRSTTTTCRASRPSTTARPRCRRPGCKEAIEKFGPIFFQFFGQSECGMTISVLRKDEHDTNDLARLATCGRAVPWLNVALLDDDLNEVPDGEPGEICVRGPLVMKGYWNKPEQTAEALKGGWLHTGDIARKDARRLPHDRRPQEGHDRLRRLQRLPARDRGRHRHAPRGRRRSRSSACRTRSGARRSRPSSCCARTRPSTAEELDRAGQGASKGAVHAPKSVDFVDAIPLSALGKPDKKALRAQYWQGTRPAGELAAYVERSGGGRGRRRGRRRSGARPSATCRRRRGGTGRRSGR